MTVLQTVKGTIKENRMLERRGSVLVALSGGPDSVALLHLLSRLRKTLRLSLKAVYINHQIRPRAAKKEERFCQQLCDQLKVGLTVIREDIPALSKTGRLGLEETAREFRYTALERLAGENGHDRIAVGHHADDQVETILFRLARGTGPSGLTGIPAVRGKIIRPLIELTRDDILKYLKKNSVNWCEDSSNRSLRFRRNWIRHRLLPSLRKHLNPQVDAALLSLVDTLSHEEAFLDELVEKAAGKCLRLTPGGKFKLDLASYRGYATWLRRRLLRRCLRATCRNGQVPGKQVVERLDRLADQDSGAISLPSRMQATVYRNQLFIYRRERRTVKQPLVPGQSIELPSPAVRLTGRVVDRNRVSVARKARSPRVWLDWDKVTPPLEVRSVKPGDRFRPLGMKGHKKVGNYLTDCKVPGPLRDEVLLLCDREGPLWVIGYEIADRAKIDRKTRKVLTVAINSRKQVGCPAV
jgi:tRNA(Ile)-lysidine synthase